MTKLPLKTRILNSSLQLFQVYGYHKVSVDQIVEHAGTSKGGFYHNFQSKDQLLYEIHDVFISYVMKKAEQSCKENQSPISKLTGILQTFIKVFDVYKPYVTVFYEESTYLQEEYKSIIKEKRDRYRMLIDSVIQEGQETGDFRSELPATIVTMAISGMINWTYKWYKKEGPLSMEQITNVFTDLVLTSIVTDKGKEEALHYIQQIEVH